MTDLSFSLSISQIVCLFLAILLQSTAHQYGNIHLQSYSLLRRYRLQHKLQKHFLTAANITTVMIILEGWSRHLIGACLVIPSYLNMIKSYLTCCETSLSWLWPRLTACAATAAPTAFAAEASRVFLTTVILCNLPLFGPEVGPL